MTRSCQPAIVCTMEKTFYIDLGFTVEAVNAEDANERALEWVSSVEVPEHVEIGMPRGIQEPVDAGLDIT